MLINENIVSIARRDNNKKRNFLIVNKFQGKHVRTSPSSSIALFKKLADKIINKYSDDKILIIGFSETATAIGAGIAVENNHIFMQTTRESIPGREYIFFSEEHSHATEQRIVKDSFEAALEKGVSRIVFVDDELSTGKTVLNIVNILRKKYSTRLNYSVASVINCMNNENLKKYSDENIDLLYLLKLDNKSYTKIADEYLALNEGIYKECNGDSIADNIDIISLPGKTDTRLLTHGKCFLDACDKLSDEILLKVSLNQIKSILVLGTEEFMYPAIYTGVKLEKMGFNVKTHSTTRSPISVYSSEDYILNSRYKLKSLYDDDRTTYLYDIDKYDLVIVITDSPSIKNSNGVSSLYEALTICGNKNIKFIRWC